jgi:hypothetical protein
VQSFPLGLQSFRLRKQQTDGMDCKPLLLHNSWRQKMKKTGVLQLVSMIYGLSGAVMFEIIYRFDVGLIFVASMALVTFISCLFMTITYWRKELFGFWSFLFMPLCVLFYMVVFLLVSGWIFSGEPEDNAAGLMLMFVFIFTFLLSVIHSLTGMVFIWRVHKNRK